VGEQLRDELRRRGLQTALEELASDGPSAFKKPEKVIEYVMVNLQHSGEEGIVEAFRFTAPPAGKVSFVSGNPMSSDRISWRKGRVIEGYVSGAALGWDEFRDEVVEHYPILLDCANWQFAVLHPQTFEPCARVGENDFAREYLLSVDDVPVALRLIYDWGSWCYLLYSVEVLGGEYAARVAGTGSVTDTGAPGHQGKRTSGRMRGGNI